ncbi:type VII secretion integral membrane protein EccD [Krasilnikovia sp. M28-CT-15]|uniref:type VII secretion integral membrane protein EccD n=1 Tax=Krasilnikovia sp. M28-CT-15 TaxID=3373540 RepID=UPI0038763D6D
MTTVRADDVCRLTVVAPHARTDVAVPVDTSLAELIAVLVQAMPDAAAGDGRWVLQRLGGTPLDAGATATTLGLLDGEVLHLRPRATPLPAIDFDDVVDGVATAVADLPGRWRPAFTRRLLLGLSGLAFAVGLAVLLGGGAAIPRAAAALLAASGLTVAATTASRAFGDAAAAVLLAAAAVAYAMCGGALLPAAVTAAPTSAGPALLTGGACATAVAMLGLVGIGGRAPLLPGCVVLTLAAAAAGLLICTGVSGAQAAAAVGAAAFVLGVLTPAMAVRLVRLRLPQLPSGAEELQQDIDPLPEHDVRTRAGAAHGYLGGFMIALGAVCLAAAPVTLTGPGWAPPVLVALWSVALLLRSRILVATGQRLAAVVPGAAGLAAIAVTLAARLPAGARPAVAVGALAVALLLLAAARRTPARRPGPYWGRLADLTETLTAVAVVPVLLAVLDLYAALRDLAG